MSDHYDRYDGMDELLSTNLAEVGTDCISRQAAIEAINHICPVDTEYDCTLLDRVDVRYVLSDLPSAQPDFDEWCTDCKEYDQKKHCCPRFNRVIRNALKDAQPKPKWIPVTERLPENIKPVIVTWENTDPKSYYQYIVGKHFIGTAHYKSGKWYWYSSVTEDLLAEYGRCDSEELDEAIKVLAWMPLPEPYREETKDGT